MYKTILELSSEGYKQPREEPNESDHNEKNSRQSKRQKISTSFGLEFLIFLLENDTQTFKEVLTSSKTQY